MKIIGSNFKGLTSTLFRSALLCVITILAGIMLSSCQKDSTGDPDPTPTPPPTPPPTEGRIQLPVIFHVIYKSSTDAKQYVSASRITKILDNVNKMYRSTVGSVDMNIEFVLASTAPSGKTLSAPGVEYINWSQEYPGEGYPIDSEAIMTSNITAKYVPILWDPNKYINVLLYNFTTDNSGYTTLGVAHLPYVNSAKNTLEGLTEVSNTYLTLANLPFAYGVLSTVST